MYEGTISDCTAIEGYGGTMSIISGRTNLDYVTIERCSSALDGSVFTFGFRRQLVLASFLTIRFACTLGTRSQGQRHTHTHTNRTL